MGFLMRYSGGSPDIAQMYHDYGLRRPYVEPGDGYYAQYLIGGKPGGMIRVAGIMQVANIRHDFSRLESQSAELYMLGKTILDGKYPVFDCLLVSGNTYEDDVVNSTSALYLLTLMGCLKWHYVITPVEKEFLRMVVTDHAPAVRAFEGKGETWLFKLGEFAIQYLADYEW